MMALGQERGRDFQEVEETIARGVFWCQWGRGGSGIGWDWLAIGWHETTEEKESGCFCPFDEERIMENVKYIREIRYRD